MPHQPDPNAHPPAVATALAAPPAGTPARTRRLPLLVVGAVVPYVLNTVFIVACHALGLLEAVHAWHYILAVIAIFGLFALASIGLPRGGASARWQTLAQLVTASLPAVDVAYHMSTTGARAAFVLLIISPLAWGVFLLRAREFLIIGVCYASGYAWMVWQLGQHAPQRVDLTADALVCLGLMAASLQMSYLGGYVYDLRQQLRARSAQLETTRAHLAHLAHCDELTGAPNRHHLGDALAHELASVAHADGALSVCILDVDHFKRINDTHGHAVGDGVLQRIAQAGLTAAPKPAVFGRWGGEEFLWILPGCDETTTAGLAEQLRERIAALDWSDVAPGMRVTASLGVAVWRAGWHAEELVREADCALYRAKATGRNRVHVSTHARAAAAAPPMALLETL